MNKSYKIALVAALVFCGALLAYYLTQPPAGSVDTESGAPAPAPSADVPDPGMTVPSSPPVSAVTGTKRPPETPAPAAPVTPPPAASVTPRPAPTGSSTARTEEPPTLVFGPTLTGPPAPTTPPPTGTKTPAPSPTAARAAQPQTYIIKSGDTLVSIAAAQYGSEKYWDDIAQMNPLIDPIRLRPGDVIKLPGKGDLDIEPAAGVAATGGKYHVIRPGETLATIARQHYGSSAAWKIIYNANRDQIGSDPDRIQVGVRLVVPPRPRTSR